MELVVLGSGTTIPHADRGCAAYALVADDGSVLLLDCGPGSSRRYPPCGIDPRRIVGIVNTHHHADHCAELPILLFLRNVLEPPIDAPWILAGPVGHAAFVTTLTSAFATGLADAHASMRIAELVDRSTLVVGPFTVTAREVAHIPGALGLHVACDGTAMMFSGDSGPCDALVDLVRDSDLALLECSYAADRESASHLTTKTAAEIAVRAGAKRIVLTHFYPECLETDREAAVRAAGYGDDLVLATDGLRIVVEPAR